MVLFEAETPDKQNMSQIAQNWFGAVKSVTGDDNGITMHHKGWGSKGVYFVQWFEDMKDMVKTMESQESKTEKVATTYMYLFKTKILITLCYIYIYTFEYIYNISELQKPQITVFATFGSPKSCKFARPSGPTEC